MGAPFFLSSFIKYCFEKRPSHFCAKKVALSAHKIISLCIYYLHYNFFFIKKLHSELKNVIIAATFLKVFQKDKGHNMLRYQRPFL